MPLTFQICIGNLLTIPLAVRLKLEHTNCLHVKVENTLRVTVVLEQITFGRPLKLVYSFSIETNDGTVIFHRRLNHVSHLALNNHESKSLIENTSISIFLTLGHSLISKLEPSFLSCTFLLLGSCPSFVSLASFIHDWLQDDSTQSNSTVDVVF